MDKKILITGGAGFIGSHAVRHFVNTYPEYQIYNLDKLTYAGNLENLKDVEGKSNYTFLKADISDNAQVDSLFNQFKFDNVIHLAAESHVDRSILDPSAFVKTNVLGTINLLNAARKYWQGNPDNLFYHISTDEVYGSLGAEGYFTESTSYDPRSPYSASKASSDHLVRAFHHTYGMHVVISNCSNNYGPYQFPEKLIPLIIHNIKNNLPLPVYGKGENIRDWLWVKDHVSAMDFIFHKGKSGETYNIGGSNEWKNIDIVEKLCDITDIALGREKGTSRNLIQFVKDRAGHDARYAIDSTKLQNELGWKPEMNFETGLMETVNWYLQNESWMKRIMDGSYMEYYHTQYTDR